MTAVVHQGSQERLRALRPGAVVVPTSNADCAGMMEATCEGLLLRVFQRDLSERSERIEGAA